jgi:CRISPR/Cas system-associated exonuclease Cas4 (RecB family)
VTGVYELPEPTTWAETPKRFSFSSLRAIEACPRKWQLLHSAWGDHPRFPERPQVKAIEGAIVHEAIEMLVVALGQRGLPSIGSPRFCEALEACEFWQHFDRAIDGWNRRLAEHPRAGPHDLVRTPAQQLANRAIRLVREQYTPLDAEPRLAAGAEPTNEQRLVDPMSLLRARRVLSEVELQHPELPFGGIIDFIELADIGIQIVDFKTGKPKDDHELQLRLYAVLWWRRTGTRPARLVAQYLADRREFEVTEGMLVQTEQQLAATVERVRVLLDERPAEARPSKDCSYCPARARCAAGWHAYQTAIGGPRVGTTDVEVAVLTDPAANGFLADVGGREVHVVYAAASRFSDLAVGDHLRLLDVVARDEGVTFEIRPWTEVYRVPG